MPLPDEKVKGFGYLTGRGAAAEEGQDLSEDSRLSSTSLNRTLVEPSSSEDWLWLEDDEEDELRAVSYTAVRQMSYFKRTSLRAAKEAGLHINFKEIRERDKQRGFQSQVVPILPHGDKVIEKRRPTYYSKVGLSMPLMQKLGMVEEERDEERWLKTNAQKGRKRIEGLVGDIIDFLEKRPRRSESQRKDRSGSVDAVVRTRRRLTLLASDVDPETFFTQEIFSYDEYHALAETADINIVYDKRASSLRFENRSEESSESDEERESLISADSIGILKRPSLMHGKVLLPKMEL